MAEDDRQNTHRFKTLAGRLSAIHVNAARSLRHAGVLDPANRDASWHEEPWDDVDLDPHGGGSSAANTAHAAAAQASAVLVNRSLFAQELGRCVTSFRERRLGLLYFDLKQRVESLPELLHHLPYVVAALVAGLREVAACTPGTPHSLLGAVCGVVSGDAPDLCGHAFRCLSYVVKGLAAPLGEDPGQLRRYYGPLLGHGRDFVRRFAAESFAPVARKLKKK